MILTCVNFSTHSSDPLGAGAIGLDALDSTAPFGWASASTVCATPRIVPERYGCFLVCAQETDFADDLADDEVDEPLASAGASKDSGGGGDGGGGELPSGKPLDKNNPFNKDPASYTIFSQITDSRYQKKIKAIATELHDYAEEHQTMLRQRLTYEELLQGMMYPGAIPTPMRVFARSFFHKPARVSRGDQRRC